MPSAPSLEASHARDMVFVVIDHLGSERTSKMADIMQSSTSMRVVQVEGSAPLQGGQVYVIPPGRQLVLTHNEVRTEEFENPRWSRAPIDTFFRSLAERGADAVAIDLSGTGTDGSAGEASWVHLVVRPGSESSGEGGLALVVFLEAGQADGSEEEAVSGEGGRTGLRALTDKLEQRVEERTVELRTALDLFHALFHAIPAPIAMTRSKDGFLVEANRAYRDLFGYGPEEMNDTRYLPRRHWANERQRERVLAELAENGHVHDVEVELTTKSGERLTALAFVEQICVDDAPYELAVFIDITVRKNAEQQVRRLASKLTIAEQEERSRVAHVLHDDLQQRLYGARYKLEGIRQRAMTEDESVIAALAPLREVEQWLEESVDEMRRLTVDLSPPVLDGEGLADALAWLVSQMRAVHGLDVSLTTERAHTIREPDQRIMMFQIVRELLFNVVKHADVERAEIRLAEENGNWKIEVIDEGKGFDASLISTGDPGPGFGLPHLRERVNLFGGSLELDTASGEGTRVTIFLPIPPESDQP